MINRQRLDQSTGFNVIDFDRWMMFEGGKQDCLRKRQERNIFCSIMASNVTPNAKTSNLFATLFNLDYQGIVVIGTSDQRVSEYGSFISDRKRRNTQV